MNRFLLSVLTGVLGAACAFASEQNSSGYQSPPHVRVKTLVEGTPLHGIQGLTWGHDGYLYAAAVAAQTLSRIDPKTGAVETLVKAPDGESDDVDLGPDGTLVWTAMVGGELRMKHPGEPVRVLADDLPGLNPVAFSPDGRLFAVTMGSPSRLWEFYLDGRAPQLVSDTIGILNSFDFSADGALYGPYWRSGRLVQIDVDTGETVVLAENQGSPTAVELDSQGRLISVDYSTGEVRRTDPETGTTAVLAVLDPPLDNLAVGPDDTIYVSESARSGVIALSSDGTVQRRLTGGEFSTPGGIDFAIIDGKETLVVADSTGYRFVDPDDGTVARLPYKLDVGGSTNVAASDGMLALTDGRRGRLQVLDAVSMKILHDETDINASYGVDILPDGSVLFAEYGTGRVRRWTASGIQTITDTLRTPVGLAIESSDAVLVSENGPGVITHINLSTGSATKIHDGLSRPEGLAVMSDGRIAVAETGLGRLVAIDPATGDLEVLVADLALGVAAVRAPLEVGMPTGVAIDQDGAIYVSEDKRNAIIKIEIN